MTMRRLIESMSSDGMRSLLERLEYKTKTGVTLGVISGGKGADPAPQERQVKSSAPPPSAEGVPLGMAGSEHQGISRSAGVRVGDTVESGSIRLHRYNSSLQVTDISNAGKRGKSCGQFSLYNLDYMFTDAKYVDSVGSALSKISKVKTYDEALKIAQSVAGEDRDTSKVPIEIRKLRGVDVDPPATAMGGVIRMDTKEFKLEASATDFSVHEKPRPGPNGDDTRILMPPVRGAEKTAIKAFYAWVKENEAKIKRMTFRELNRAMADAKLNYHSFSTMD